MASPQYGISHSAGEDEQKEPEDKELESHSVLLLPGYAVGGLSRCYPQGEGTAFETP
jgi:hypothetical protein